MHIGNLGKTGRLAVGRFCALACWRVLPLVGLLPWLGGCPMDPNVVVNGNDNEASAPTTAVLQIISFRNNFEISELEPAISVIYSVETNGTDNSGVDVTAFYVPVADASEDAAETGDRVVIASGLSIGAQRAFTFDPAVTGVGFYRVGIIVTIGSNQFVDTSDGVIQVQGPPNPRFIQPTEAVTEVSPGAEVIISFDAGDPEGVVQWRVFYLTTDDVRTDDADELGTQLRVGSGNVGSLTFSTAGLEPGDYEIGISATDSGLSISSTVSNGDTDRIITIPSESVAGPIVRVTEQRIEMPPTLVFGSPATEIDIFGDDEITIDFAAEINEAGAVGLIDIFYDDDRTFTNRIFPIATDLSASETSIQFDTRMIPEEGTYFIGGSVRDGVNPRVVQYAAGSINIVRGGSLEVTQPSTSRALKPVGAGEEPEVVNIVWETNVPEDIGTVEVTARTVGQTTTNEYTVLAESPTSVMSTEFSADMVGNRSGLYEIVVRITLDDSVGIAPIVGTAPALIRVSSLPTVLWLRDLDNAFPPFDGAIFQGVQTEDNAGSAFSQVGDLNGDGAGEFVIAARYGKPFFLNPSGVGAGEAYMIFGDSTRYSGRFNLNSVGTGPLPGVTFTGIRTPQNSNDTDGLASISRIPDVDGDGLDELVFGFPDVESRGHNANLAQNGVVDPRDLSTLEREGQFLRGGIVIVSSQNTPFATGGLFGNGVINLDLVGQDFDSICVGNEADRNTNFAADLRNQDCEGGCGNPQGGQAPDGSRYIDFGFSPALARDYFSTYVYRNLIYGDDSFCDSVAQFLGNTCTAGDLALFPYEYCEQVSQCSPFSPGLHRFMSDPDGPEDPEFGYPLSPGYTGFYQTWLADGQDVVRNMPQEPFGARIIGVGLGDEFGSSVALSNTSGIGAGDIIVSAPGRTARGILLGPGGGPETGGEINGLEQNGAGKVNTDSGVAYMFNLRSLWTDAGNQIPPKPHQYVVGEASHCGGPEPLIPNVDATRIAGFAGDEITNIVGIDDFNEDGLDDFAIGAPNANGGQGRVYVAYRRDPGVEDDFVLEKLAKDPSDAERLSGALFVSGSADGLGFSLTSGVDFNDDGQSDLVIGSPTASNGIGEIIVVFGDSQLVTPVNGLDVDTLVASRNQQNGPRAVRITGNALDTAGQFGFNTVSAGDVDGDGFTDLLVAAPFASPRYDPDPSDEDDLLTEVGVDTNLDGENDTSENLASAGLVYVISGRNRLDQITPNPTTGEFTISIDQLGSANLKGYIIAGRRGGDHLGGGDAGDATAGGNSNKENRGRSFGLAPAGDVDGDGRDDILIGSILADPRIDADSGAGTMNGGEAYLIYSTVDP